VSWLIAGAPVKYDRAPGISPIALRISSVRFKASAFSSTEFDRHVQDPIVRRTYNAGLVPLDRLRAAVSRRLPRTEERGIARVRGSWFDRERKNRRLPVRELVLKGRAPSRHRTQAR
jgi:hypothetical protein